MKNNNDAAYFQTYDDIDGHEDMISCEVRIDAYRKSVLQNKHLFKDKVVLDIGSGTGILSLFAAEAGAAKVIAVEMSEIVNLSRKVVELNKYQDVITVIQGKIENVTLPEGVDKVDIISSEWMGNCLFAEGILHSILYARDKWLKKYGMIFPDKCWLHLAAMEYENLETPTNLNFWDQVQGYDMSCALPEKERRMGLIKEVIDPSAVVSNYCLVRELDMNTASLDELHFEAPFHIQINSTCTVNAFMAYFDVQFSKCRGWTGFSTGPDAPSTHWYQTIIPFFEKELDLNNGDGLFGTINIAQDEKDRRTMHMEIDVNQEDKNGKDVRLYKKAYYIG